MDFIAATNVDSQTIVSVVIATRNRMSLLERAIGSVLAQSYPNWELLVVDDGSGDDTEAFLAKLRGDKRIRTLRTDHVGPSAARNRALDVATGAIVTYLDDDNVMHPGWLKAVVWAFTRCPTVDVLYGARLIDEHSSYGHVGPRLLLNPFDRSELEDRTLVDTNALAHRLGLPEARWDEALSILEDREILIRLTRSRDPLMLPVLACYYMTDSENRLSASSWETATRYIKQKVRQSGDRR